MDSILRFISEEKVFIIILAILIFYFLTRTCHSENFENKKKTVYIFHAEWCPHCVNAMPMFKELINEYANDKQIDIKLVNEANNQELVKQFEIKSYPSIIMVSDGKVQKFTAQRSKENIKNFISM